MSRRLIAALVLGLAAAAPALAGPDFDAPVPAGGRANPYDLSPSALAEARRAGLVHALDYPETDHSLTLPFAMTDAMVQQAQTAPLAMQMLEAIGLARFGTTWESMFERIGLAPYPMTEGAGPYLVPSPPGRVDGWPMGAAVRANSSGVEVLAFSCVSCHSRSLFGRPVIGLNNLQPRASEFLNFATAAVDVPGFMVLLAAGGDFDQYNAFRKLQRRLALHEAVDPQALGTDSALSSMALGLSRREADAHATISAAALASPRPSPFRDHPADVKPGVWWNMKYKNRAFVDGSLRGNVALTNMLWTEVGLGADLRAFDRWVDDNAGVVQDLTAAVYASEAPRWTDFFPAAGIDVAAARRGQDVFERLCAGCHGTYAKGWDAPDAHLRDAASLLETVEVRYRAETRAFPVGTDRYRADMMQYLAPEQNRLAFAQKHGLLLEANTTGAYVPPPLVGIWARWPYLHNASVPSLCELLKPSAERVRAFYVVPAEEKGRDYDEECVGFPLGGRVAAQWRTDERYFDTGWAGLGNFGHDEGIFVEDGVMLFTPEERRDLIVYLKTL